MSLPVEFDYPEWWSEQLQAVYCEGVGAADLEQLLRDQDLADFPKSYEGFLKVAGRKCGRLWEGTDAFFPALFGLREASNELLEEGDVEGLLAATDVVIGMHQGYEFLYLSGRADDPAVFRFTEGTGAPVQVAERFTEFVLAALIETEHR